MTSEIIYTSPFGEAISPLLLVMRNTGFFEAYVFMPVMSALAFLLFARLRLKIKHNRTFDPGTPWWGRMALQFGYFTLCFVLMNSTAVAFKAFIFQELDYDRVYWFVPYVAPLHFYISSVALAHIYLISENRQARFRGALCAYVQVGLIGGYCAAFYRLTQEPFELTDVTTGMSGIFFLVWFAVLNWDIARRLPIADIPHNSQKQTTEAPGVSS